MQEHFRSTGSKLLDELNLTITDCRSAGVPIIYTQHGHNNVKLDSGVLGEFWGYPEMIRVGTHGWQLMSGLDVTEDDVKITEKRRYDAFYGTVLNDILRRLNVGLITFGETLQ